MKYNFPSYFRNKINLKITTTTDITDTLLAPISPGHTIAAEQIFINNDPFNTVQELVKSPTHNDIHIRVFKRNGKKCLTTLELSALPDIKNHVKDFITKCSKKFCCGGSYDKKENVIKFTGDIRDGLAELLETEGFCEKENIKIHGF